MKKIILLVLMTALIAGAKAQKYKGMYLYNNADSSSYLKLTFLNQVWLRYADYNPGTTIFGNKADKGFDIGLRRTRIQLFGNVYKNTFVYMQMGINNFTATSSRKSAIFFHDALVEHTIVKQKLSLGAGLTGWNGLSRYSSPSIGTILSYDAPLFAQTTNDATDQFLRKLSVYGKGQISKLDYRVVLSTPMAYQNASGATALNSTSSFSMNIPKLQSAAYVFWQFWDKESNLTPYTRGCYLGSKKILNIGAGYQYQQDAMWHKNTSGDTISTPMKNFAVDVMMDLPIDSGKKGVLTVYASQFWLDFGPNYIRNIGAMNPANGNINPAIVNGSGTGAPVLGTGNVFYGQVGYLLPKKWFGDFPARIQPYATITQANYKALSKTMLLYDLGVNLLKDGHDNKLTLNYQNRPIFATQSNGDKTVTDRKGMVVLQLQVGI